MVDLLVATGTLARYHLLYSVRGDLLDQLGRHAEAAQEFGRAAVVAQNEPERALSARRADESRARGAAEPGITAGGVP
jgi:predicted RNA polymerase sigma factor